MVDKRLSDTKVESTLQQLFTEFENHAQSATASAINSSNKTPLAADQFHRAATNPDRITSERLTTVPNEKKLFTDINSHHSYDTLPDNNSSVEYLLHHRNLKILEKHLGFTVERRQSQIEGGGTGVFVTSGTVPPDTVAALYPGVVYSPGEPLLIQSLGNAFIFRCIDGLHIDGNDRSISKMIFRSCSHRDKIGWQFTSDMSWLTPHPINPLAIGQYVNNHGPDNPANVCYQEFDFPETFPVQLRQFIPNISFSPSSEGILNRTMRTIALVSIRAIETGEELFSSYYTVIRK